MNEIRRRAHECYMSGIPTPDDCAYCCDCIGEPYEMNEFIPQLKALAKIYRKAKTAHGWTRKHGEFTVYPHWVLQIVLCGKFGEKHYLNANKYGKVWFSTVNMNCF